MPLIDGSQVTELRTLKTRYDNDSISVCTDNGGWYRLKVEELNKVLHLLTFRVVPKKVHTYLEIVPFSEDVENALDVLLEQAMEKGDLHT